MDHILISIIDHQDRFEKTQIFINIIKFNIIFIKNIFIRIFKYPAFIITWD